jgi:hypothetical protein
VAIYETQFAVLLYFAADGFVARLEMFDADRRADALARFDALTAEPTRPARRVRENAATANFARAEAALARRDFDAFAATYADHYESIDRVNHMTHDRAAMVKSFRMLFTGVAPSYRHEPLATLGDSLALGWLRVSAQGSGDELDAGAYEYERLYLFEVDARGRRTRSEAFGTDLLGDAIARLYERYAETSPEGPARDRAAAIARGVPNLLAVGPHNFGMHFAPEVEFNDHRALIALPASRGIDEVRRQAQKWFSAADDYEQFTDDVLDVRPDGFLAQTSERGRDRTTGGSFEGQWLVLYQMRGDGRVAHIEMFDVDRAADALARFDALSATSARPTRRVRPNAATAHLALHDAAIAARDRDALASGYAEGARHIDHTTAVTYDRDEMMASFEMHLAAREPSSRHEPLATLGDSLALCLVHAKAAALAVGAVDAGAFEHDEIVLIEVDGLGRRAHGESWSPARLGNAVERLYERYAERLPEGAERSRAEAAARAVATVLNPIEPDRWSSVVSPAIEFTDHRPIGFPPGRGADRFLRAVRVFYEAAETMTVRVDAILDFRLDGFVARSTSTGMHPIGGGGYERSQTTLYVLGSDGRITHLEVFEPERAADALARFAELCEKRDPLLIPPNAATRAVVRAMETFAEGEERSSTVLSDGFVFEDRGKRALVSGGPEQGRATLEFYQGAGRAPDTRADRHARRSDLRSSGTPGAGSGFEIDYIGLVEIDEAGKIRASIRFDADDRAAAFEEAERALRSGRSGGKRRPDTVLGVGRCQLWAQLGGDAQPLHGRRSRTRPSHPGDRHHDRRRTRRVRPWR